MSAIRIKPMEALQEEDAALLESLTIEEENLAAGEVETLRIALNNLYQELLDLKQRILATSEPALKHEEEKGERFWSPADHAHFVELLAQNYSLQKISEALGNKTVAQVRSHHQKFILKLKAEPCSLGVIEGFRREDGIYYAFASAIARKIGFTVELCDRVIFDGGDSLETRVSRRDCFFECSERILHARKIDVSEILSANDSFVRHIFGILERLFETEEPAGNWAHFCSYALQRSFRECEEILGAILVHCSEF